MRTGIFGIAWALTASLAGGPAVAASTAIDIGTPALVADAGTSGSLLDFFGIFGPSGVKELTAAATITAAYGLDASLIGERIELFVSPFNGTLDSTLTVAGVSFQTLAVTGSVADGSLTDEETTGVFGFKFFGSFPFSADYDPVSDTDTITYDPPFGAFGPRVLGPGDYPEFALGVNVYFDGPLPTRTYENEDDPFAPFDYIEGPVTVTRIEVGLVGGVPFGVVPLPAGLPLALAGIGALALLRQTGRRAGATANA